MSTAGKLWLGFGLLFVLLVGTGLFFAHRLASIDRALVTIMAVQEPTTAATYRMSFNVVSTGTMVLNYLETGDQEHREAFDQNVAEFEQLSGRYARIARSSVSRELGRLIREAHQRFHSLGDSLMGFSDAQRTRYAAFIRTSDDLEELLHEDMQAGLSGRGRDGQRKVSETAKLEASAAGIGAAVGNYLSTGGAEHRDRVRDRAVEFAGAMRALRDLRLTDDERRLAWRSDSVYAVFLDRAREVMSARDRVNVYKRRFVDVEAEVESLLDEGINSLARIDLVEAQRSAQRAIRTSLIAVFVLLFAGIVIGAATAIPTARSIVRADEALRERMEELAVADRRKDEFLGMLGHELRNPLAPLSNALHVIEQRGQEVPDDVRKGHAMMRRQVANISRLVDDLLDVSRINLGKITLKRRPVSLGALVAEVVQDQNAIAQALHHQLKVSVPEVPVFVNADPGRMAQVVANLLNNAIKYTPEGGHIEITVGAEGARAFVRVRDDGVGIPAGMLGRVFDPFTQLGAVAGTHGGLGMGLALVRRLMAMHDGTCRAESDGLGRGSTFTVRMPRLAHDPVESEEAAPAARADEAATPHAARRVLVVDDNRDAADSLAELVEMWGHQVTKAHRGETALEIAGTFRPDLVLLDIGLPDLDGYQVARRLRARPELANTVVVALTGLGQEEDVRQAKDAGFDLHLTKPISLDKLRRLLDLPSESRSGTPASDV